MWDPADPATWHDEASRFLAKYWPERLCTAKQFVRFCRQVCRDGLAARALHEEQFRGEARIRNADIEAALATLHGAIYFRPQRLTTPTGLLRNLRTDRERQLMLTFLRDYLETTRHCEPSVGQAAAALAEAAYRKSRPAANKRKPPRRTIGAR